jgi:threonine-phosphate decarboxylase
MNTHGGNIYHIERTYHIPKNELYDFSSNINPIGIPRSVKQHIIDNLNLITAYPDPEYKDLYDALSLYTGTPREYILSGNGASQLIYTYMSILQPRSVLIVAPTFSEYSQALIGIKTVVEYFELREENGFLLNAERLCMQLAKGYDLLVICNPNNPTSTYIDQERMQKILYTTKQYNTHFLVDESFIDFLDEGISQSVFCLEKRLYQNLFIVHSLTKFFAIPGLRLGYAICSNKRMTEEIKHAIGPWPINTMAALIGEKLLGLTDFQYQSRQLIKEEKKKMYRDLQQFTWAGVYKPAVNFILVKLLGGMTALFLKRELLKYNILVRDARNFTFLDESFIRLAIKDRKSNDYLIETLSRL